MKRISAALLILLLAASAALADVTLVDPYAEAPGEAAMTEYLAACLEAAWEEAVAVRHETDDEQAVNLFLSLPGESAALLCSQGAMILSLQGYTDQDLRKALLPVACVAASDSCFFLSPAAAEAVPAGTGEALAAYCEAHPWEMRIVRLVDASPADCLTLEATWDMPVDQSLYVDYGEAAKAAEQGAEELLVLSTAMLPEAAKSYVRLGSTGLPGLWQGVFVQRQGADALAARLAEALPAICEAPGWQALLQAGGYTGEMALDQASFARTVQDLYEDYVRYLTNEGLFFYEE